MPNDFIALRVFIIEYIENASLLLEYPRTQLA